MTSAKQVLTSVRTEEFNSDQLLWGAAPQSSRTIFLNVYKFNIQRLRMLQAGVIYITKDENN